MCFVCINHFPQFTPFLLGPFKSVEEGCYRSSHFGNMAIWRKHDISYRFSIKKNLWSDLHYHEKEIRVKNYISTFASFTHEAWMIQMWNKSSETTGSQSTNLHSSFLSWPFWFINYSEQVCEYEQSSSEALTKTLAHSTLLDTVLFNKWQDSSVMCHNALTLKSNVLPRRHKILSYIYLSCKFFLRIQWNHYSSFLKGLWKINECKETITAGKYFTCKAWKN
jgi:hypothetical protein